MTTEPGVASRSRPRWAHRLTLATRPAVLAGLLALWLAVTGLPRDASGTLGWLVLLALAVAGVAGGRRLAGRPDAPALLLGAAGALLLLVAARAAVVGLLAQGLLDHTLQFALIAAATGLLVGLAAGRSDSADSIPRSATLTS